QAQGPDAKALRAGEFQPLRSTSEIGGSEEARAGEFEVLLQTAAREQIGRLARRSLREEVIDFIIPRIGDPTILRGEHSVSILEHLVCRLLPSLQGTEEMRAVAAAVLSDEIVRHRDLVSRIHRGIAG